MFDFAFLILFAISFFVGLINNGRQVLVNVVMLLVSAIVCLFALLLCQIEFIVWAFILVYLGAVMVLFLFVVMLCNLLERFGDFRWTVLFSLATFDDSVPFLNFYGPHETTIVWNTIYTTGHDLHGIAQLLYHTYSTAFYDLCFLLLIAMLTALAIALN